MIYNSALKNGTKQFQGMPPTQRFEYQGCIGRRRNIISEGYFEELDTCDVIYCEPPFPAGIKVFDERAKEKTSSYNDFAQGFRRLWDMIIDKPKLAITNKKLEKYLPEPDQHITVKLNGHWTPLSCWGIEVPEGQTNLELCEYLGKTYSRMGDITCGYGLPVLHFRNAKSGNTFVASDYDAHCISVLRMLMNENTPQG